MEIKPSEELLRINRTISENAFVEEAREAWDAQVMMLRHALPCSATHLPASATPPLAQDDDTHVMASLPAVAVDMASCCKQNPLTVDEKTPVLTGESRDGKCTANSGVRIRLFPARWKASPA